MILIIHCKTIIPVWHTLHINQVNLASWIKMGLTTTHLRCLTSSSRLTFLTHRFIQINGMERTSCSVPFVSTSMIKWNVRFFNDTVHIVNAHQISSSSVFRFFTNFTRSPQLTNFISGSIKTIHELSYLKVLKPYMNFHRWFQKKLLFYIIWGNFSIFSNGGHLGCRARSPSTILKWDYTDSAI
jgi:hypothetical protein